MFNRLLTLFCFLLLSVAEASTTTISKTSVTPTTAESGAMFKFSATLDASLTNGNKVKIDLGNGLASMSCTIKTCLLSRVIKETGIRTYKIGVYNDKNILQGVTSGGTYSVLNNQPVNHPPTVSIETAKDVTLNLVTYTLTVKGTDIDKNLDSITVDWGDKTPIDIQAAAENIDVTFDHTYEKTGSFLLSVFASDRGTPSLNSQITSKGIQVKKVEIRTGKGNYTKVCNSGALAGEENCPINPKLGSKNTDWGCTKDNDTDLLWEVKTTDDGYHDMGKVYTNYTTNYDPDNLYQEKTNVQGLVLISNEKNLCGRNNWRLPSKIELISLILCSDGIYNSLLNADYSEYHGAYVCASNSERLKTKFPTINKTYFPNTATDRHWSMSPYGGYLGGDEYGAWDVNFLNGKYDTSPKRESRYVRLVSEWY
jgi:hypothetical protein